MSLPPQSSPQDSKSGLILLSCSLGTSITNKTQLPPYSVHTNADSNVFSCITELEAVEEEIPAF